MLAQLRFYRSATVILIFVLVVVVVLVVEAGHRISVILLNALSVHFQTTNFMRQFL